MKCVSPIKTCSICFAVSLQQQKKVSLQFKTAQRNRCFGAFPIIHVFFLKNMLSNPSNLNDQCTGASMEKSNQMRKLLHRWGPLNKSCTRCSLLWIRVEGHAVANSFKCIFGSSEELKVETPLPLDINTQSVSGHFIWIWTNTCKCMFKCK